MDPVTAGTLAELIATAATSATGRAWKKVRGTPEGRAVKAAIDEAVSEALRTSVFPPSSAVDDMWVAEIEKIWRPAFTPDVSQRLVACLTDPSAESARRFGELATGALVDAGCDLDQLERTFWVKEFLAVLPRLLFDSFKEASRREPTVRSLMEILLQQREDARFSGEAPPTPGEFRQDLIALLRGLDKQARKGRLPTYLPEGADVTALARTVRVRLEVRSDPGVHAAEGNTRRQEARRLYQLPVERAVSNEPTRPWPEIVTEQRRLVVLADPGLGKSWLIRTETHRLCQDALGRLAEGTRAAVIPVAVRCDQLATAAGQDLADKAATYLVAQGLLPERSRAGLAAKIRAGEAVVLLDALDELTSAESGALRELVRRWADQAGDHARCVITSRIAGYTGSPLPGAREVELQAFSDDDAVAAMDAWRMPLAVTARLRDRLADPAIGAMARIPLLLALLCSLAASQPVGEALPHTRGELYERVLRWFLTRAHRSQDDPGAPALDDIEIDALLEILAPLAYSFAAGPAGWIDLMPSGDLLNAIRSTGTAFTELHRSAAQVLHELSVNAGVLVPEGNPSAGRTPRYLFLHRTMAEYLTARYLANLPQADWLTIVDQHRWFDPDWAQVLPMLGELLSPQATQRLIQHLIAIEPDPFHHSLFTAVRIWGARPDADHILSSTNAAELVRRLDDLFQRSRTRYAVVSAYADMAYLPHVLRTGLLARLANPEEVLSIRSAAAAALVGREDPEVTRALLASLRDPNHHVREEMVRVLARRPAWGMTGALLASLDDEVGMVRYQAVGALAGRKDSSVTEALVACLADRGRSIRWQAVEALAGRKDPGVTEALLARLTDEESYVREKAVQALAGRKDPRVTEALLARLADRHRGISSAAVTALASLEDPGVTEALLARLTDKDSSVRRGAVRTVAHREMPGATEALLARLEDEASPVRSAAAEALASRKDPGVTEALLAHVADTDWEVRYEALKALAGRDAAGMTEALLTRLTDQSGSVRYAAVTAVASLNAPGVTEALFARLSDEIEDVRAAAVSAVASRQAPGVMNALLACLGDPEGEVRDAVKEAIANRKDPGVTEALIARLDDPDEDIRHDVIDALSGRKEPGVTEALLVRLTNEDSYVRFEAARALAGRDDPAVIEALIARISDEDSHVRIMAAHALAESETPQALLYLAKEVQTLSPSSLPLAIDAAETLMIRHYHRLDPDQQPQVRSAIGNLTTAVLMSDSV